MEFSSMQDMLEKVKDIEDSLRYDIGSQMSLETAHSNVYANNAMARSSKWMIGTVLLVRLEHTIELDQAQGKGDRYR